MSAYILILPGMGLKLISDAALWFQFSVKPNWFKAKLVGMTNIIPLLLELKLIRQLSEVPGV